MLLLRRIYFLVRVVRVFEGNHWRVIVSPDFEVNIYPFGPIHETFQSLLPSHPALGVLPSDFNKVGDVNGVNLEVAKHWVASILGILCDILDHVTNRRVAVVNIKSFERSEESRSQNSMRGLMLASTGKSRMEPTLAWLEMYVGTSRC